MRIAVIDDTPSERGELSDYIKRYFTENFIYKTVDFFENGEQFLSVWKRGAYDLIFIDIYLSGINGIDLAENIRQTDDNCILIFTTNSADFAVKGFEVRASDYLVKPFPYDKFKTSMDYCIRTLQKRSSYIEVKESRTMVKIRLEDILFTDYFNHYILIHTYSRIVKSYMKFDDFSPLLLRYPQFLCCYRNCIVNMDKVISVEKNDFILVNEERVPIIRRKRQEIHQSYADYQFKKLNGEEPLT